MKLSVVIPAFNESSAIAKVLREAQTILSRKTSEYEIIVVDDGSADPTADEAAKVTGVRVIRHRTNQGYGRALATGIHAAENEWILICDADGSYDFKDLTTLLEDCEHYDLIVGVRRGKEYEGTGFKRIARFFQVLLAEFVTGTAIPDVNSGFRLMRKSKIEPLFDYLCRGFSFTTSSTIVMILKQYAVRFVPIQYRAREGKSHTRLLRDGLRSLQILTQCILRFNPIKAFLAVSILEFVLFLFLSLPLIAFNISAIGFILWTGAWVGLMCLTLCFGFVAFAIQCAFDSSHNAINSTRSIPVEV